MFKNVLLMILVVGALILIFSQKENKNLPPPIQEPIQEVKEVAMCFYSETPSPIDSSLFDRASLRMNILGDKVNGEFKNLPAQTDSNFGTFEGTVGPVVPEIMGRIADVWWNSESEGMVTKRELRIIFGEGNASVGFGELVDRGDGVYVYVDKEKIEVWKNLTDVGCEDLDDREIVNRYIRENISTLVPEEPVLGGNFYALKITINPFSKTGVFDYEDGHIAGTASFVYERNKDEVIITDVKKIN